VGNPAEAAAASGQSTEAGETGSVSTTEASR